MPPRKARSKRRPRKRLALETLEPRALLHGAGTLSGYVYLDMDSDGNRGASDFGIPGVVVELSDGDSSDTSSRSTLTDDQGFYSFDELEPGNYEISERQSAALIDGQDSTPLPEAVSANDLFSNMVLADDQNSEENNFGEQGLHAEFINIRWYLASTPPPHQMLRETMALAEEITGNASLAQSIRAGGPLDDDTPDPPDATNSTPVATDDTYTVEENQELGVNIASGVLANDRDPDGDTLTATLVDPAGNGSVTLNSDGSFTYTPENNFTGDDTFTYAVNDGQASSTATVVITVTPAMPNTFTVDENSPVGTVVGQIMPTGAAGESFEFEFDDPSFGDTFQLDRTTGQLTVADSGDLDFETNPSFTFAVNVSNGSTSTVSVTVRLRNLNEAGPVAADDSYEVDEDTALNVSATIGVLSNDNDDDGDTLIASIADQPDHGTLVLNNDGSFVYTPDSNFSGTDQFSYEATDGEFTDNATVTIVVNSVNDVPVANNNTYSTEEDTPLTVQTASGVLTNDTDADGDNLTAQLVDQPNDGTIDLNQDGSFVYTPDVGFSGSDSFTYQANDGTAASNIATVTINVNRSNRPPVAADDDYTAVANEVLTVGEADGVLANDTDPDGDTLAAGIVDQAANGVVVLNPDGTFTYTPNSNFSGDDSFTYRANDGAVNSEVATVTITVTPANELFGPVTPGSSADPGLLGTRADLLPGAPPITRNHVNGEIDYSDYSNPPTYGPHHGFDPQGTDSNPGITPRRTGIYDTEQPEEDLIHNLEHGHVWISYNPTLLSDSDRQALEQFVRDGSPNPNGGGVGVILTPRAANDTAIALASWARLLTLSEFDPATIRAFVETNRGKAPEGFITP